MEAEDLAAVYRRQDALYWAVLSIASALETICVGARIEVVATALNEMHMRITDIKKLFDSSMGSDQPIA